MPFVHDYCVIGAGIVGLAAAAALGRRSPGASIVVVDKEATVGRHQSGHNSGVLHSGIYYPPKSLKAEFCREARRALPEFCAEHGVAFQPCGKLIVASDRGELPRLRRLLDRGREHGLKVEPLGEREIADIEPAVRAVAGVWVPETGVVDFVAMCRALADVVQSRGGEVLLDHEVSAIDASAESVEIVASGVAIRARYLVNCAGLQSDRIALLAGVEPGARIIPFRGEYFDVTGPRADLVRGLIYPVPDPAFPFLGVHLTRGIHGDVHAGPNAVLALKREGYRWRDVAAGDIVDLLSYPGFWRLVRRHGRDGTSEMARSLSKALFVRSVRRLVPALEADDLHPAVAGVRAQAIGPDGSLVDDFLIVEGPRSLHVCNAPSPAASASLSIGEAIADRVCAAAAL